MQAWELKGSATRFSLALVLFLLALLLPYALFLIAETFGTIPLSRAVRNFLFFWPQMALFPYGINVYENGDTQTYMYDYAIYFAVAFWIVIGVTHSRITRKWKLLYSGLSVYPTILMVTIILNSLLSVFDIYPYLEGP